MLSIHQAEYQQKSTLRNLMELYKYDFSEYDPEDVNENGLYEYVYLDHYWTEAGRHPFLFRVEGQLAGFALIREIESEQGTSVYEMAEFFVMKKYRKLGVGAQAAIHVFNLFPGTWKIAEMETNEPAQIFWRKVIARFTDNKYQELREPDWDGPIQIFTTK
ncbi:GNAT family N-acetyltransferase [Paenibacillus taichungensis]|uniref:GNAT family N-acetyltransferase n=1 Tax=Paenibacillus taichungensis TaxID=484184 RepID=A0ABX2MX01_9BACL|nr:GNAT family N-acetyltransferase [Paenibacillus taichungensis]NUU58617.1 GNAT family N-acetyltransferase [Paenibacillus taichungensis]